jgi:hypothetical protein
MKCYAQKGYTTVYIFANPDCHCTLQFAKGKEPFGEKSFLRRDTMFIGVSPKSSGFYVSCGDSTTYYEIKYRIDGYYKIKINCTPDISNKALPGEMAGNYNFIHRSTKGQRFYLLQKRTGFKTSQ